MSEEKNPRVTVIPANHPRAEQTEIDAARAEGEEIIRKGTQTARIGFAVDLLGVASLITSIGGYYKNNATIRKYTHTLDAIGYVGVAAGILLMELGATKRQIGKLKIEHANFRQKVLAGKVDQQIAEKDQTAQIA